MQQLPEMFPVESSNVAKIGHASPATLFVEFKNGGVYAYNGVDEPLFDRLRRADSIGKFLNSEIKGKFPFVKVN